MNVHEAHTLALRLLSEHAHLTTRAPAECGHLFGERCERCTRIGFEWSRGHRTFGCYRVRRQASVWSRSLRLSRDLVACNTLELVERTIRHEIAHAIAGVHAGHGQQWSAACATMGIPGEAPMCANAVMPASIRWRARCQCQEHVRVQAPPAGRVYRCMTCRQALAWVDTRAQRAMVTP